MELDIDFLKENLEEAEKELTPRVVDGKCGLIEACAAKISEAFTAVRYWQRRVEGGSYTVPLEDRKALLEDLNSAQDSLKAYADEAGWKDDRIGEAFALLEVAIDEVKGSVALEY